MTAYNGHPSRNYWNVSLWINNDEVLYRTALECIRAEKTRRDAAVAMLGILRERYRQKFDQNPHLIPTTPDGAPYTINSIQHAMRGME